MKRLCSQPEMGGFLLESIFEGFQMLIGTKWEQDGNFNIDARDARTSPAGKKSPLGETHPQY